MLLQSIVMPHNSVNTDWSPDLAQNECNQRPALLGVMCEKL